MVGHRLKSDQHGSTATRTGPVRTYMYGRLTIACQSANSADSSSLFSTHLAYNCHQQLTLTSVHESYDNMPLEHPSANSHVHLTHQICGGFQDKAVTKYSTAA